LNKPTQPTELLAARYVMATLPDGGLAHFWRTMMSRIITAAFTAVVLLGSVSLLSACNTVAGAGQDVSSAGHAVTNGAESVK
jgi:predicted small secreted protein